MGGDSSVPVPGCGLALREGLRGLCHRKVTSTLQLRCVLVKGRRGGVMGGPAGSKVSSRHHRPWGMGGHAQIFPDEVHECWHPCPLAM